MSTDNWKDRETEELSVQEIEERHLVEVNLSSLRVDVSARKATKDR